MELVSYCGGGGGAQKVLKSIQVAGENILCPKVLPTSMSSIKELRSFAIARTVLQFISCPFHLSERQHS